MIFLLGKLYNFYAPNYKQFRIFYDGRAFTLAEERISPSDFCDRARFFGA